MLNGSGWIMTFKVLQKLAKYNSKSQKGYNVPHGSETSILLRMFWHFWLCCIGYQNVKVMSTVCKVLETFANCWTVWTIDFLCIQNIYVIFVQFIGTQLSKMLHGIRKDLRVKFLKGIKTVHFSKLYRLSYIWTSKIDTAWWSYELNALGFCNKRLLEHYIFTDLHIWNKATEAFACATQNDV